MAGFKEHGSIFINEVQENYSHPFLYAADEGQTFFLFVEGDLARSSALSPQKTTYWRGAYRSLCSDKR